MRSYEKLFPFFSQLMIGATGKKLHMLSSHVAWSQMALEAAKAEGKPASYISKIKKIVSQGKQAHNEVKHEDNMAKLMRCAFPNAHLLIKPASLTDSCLMKSGLYSSCSYCYMK